MIELVNSTFFYVGLCIIVYSFSIWLQKKTKQAWLNPLLVSILLIIGFLLLFQIPYDSFQSGTSFISMMLTPATVVLAIPMFRQFEVMKKNLPAILIGTFIGALSSIGSVLFFSSLFGLDKALTNSLLPKSVTTPIAISISEVNGGIAAVTVAAVLITGIIGSLIIPGVLKKLKMNHSVTLGITMGTASHALGTSKAVEIGEKEGGLAGLAIGITGIFTVILCLFLHL